MNNPLVSLISLFETLLDGADEKMLEMLENGNRNDIYISAPDVLITLFRPAMMVRNHLDSPYEFKKVILINCTNLVPAFDWAITLYHKDYSFYKESWMIRRLPLNTAIKIREGSFEKTIIYLDEAGASRPEKIQLS